MKKIYALLIAFFSMFFFITPAKAAIPHVYDEYGLLDSSEVQELENLAVQYSNEHDCGIYIYVMNDNDGYWNIEDYAEELFMTLGMNSGSDGSGVLLVLTMEDRSYDICAYGDKANSAFTDYAKNDYIVGKVVPMLSYGDYSGAFKTFIECCDYCLDLQEAGTPLDVNSDPEVIEREEAQKRAVENGVTFGVPPVIAAIASFFMKRKMKTTGVAMTAGNYIPKGGFRLMQSQDMFLYRRETRTPIIRSSGGGHGGGGGGTSINAGGFSHSSGHF